jgi:GT2 family glycosyltransferase
VVIVVSYQSADELPACLDSLLDQRDVDLEIHVVDNASRDGSAALVRERYPQVRLHANADNRGFARANNQILCSTHAAMFALVNPDTVLAPTAIAACRDLLERRPDVGVVATRLVYPDGALQPSCHSFLTLTNLFGEALGLDYALPWIRPLSSLNMRWFGHDRPADVDWIQGAFLVVRGRVVDELGGFDPEFFMFAEEMDWCFRIRRAGWKVAFLPDPAVMHMGGASSRPMAGPMFVENLKGRLRFLRKHRGAWAEGMGRVFLSISVLGRLTAREAQARMRSLGGKPLGEPLRLRLEMFRSAAAWVMRGLPITPFAPPRSGREAS